MESKSPPALSPPFLGGSGHLIPCVGRPVEASGSTQWWGEESWAGCLECAGHTRFSRFRKINGVWDSRKDISLIMHKNNQHKDWRARNSSRWVNEACMGPNQYILRVTKSCIAWAVFLRYLPPLREERVEARLFWPSVFVGAAPRQACFMLESYSWAQANLTSTQLEARVPLPLRFPHSAEQTRKHFIIYRCVKETLGCGIWCVCFFSVKTWHA